MLSFLKEQKITDDPKNPAGKNPQAKNDSHQTQSAGQEYLTVAARDKDVRKTTILLAVLFAMGLLGVLFMIKKSTPKTATAAVSTEETRIEMAIARLIGNESAGINKPEEIVNKFYELSDMRQVKVNELVKNPFKHEVVYGSTRIADARATALPSDSDDMQLLSIMATNDGSFCCMIDDKILSEGDTIKGFRVRQITDSFVKLESEGTEVILRIDY